MGEGSLRAQLGLNLHLNYLASLNPMCSWSEGFLPPSALVVTHVSIPAVSSCLHRLVQCRSSLCMGTTWFMQRAMQSQDYNTCLHKSCGTAVHCLILEARSRMSPWTRSDNYNNQLECHSVAASNQDAFASLCKTFQKMERFITEVQYYLSRSMG